MRVSTVIQELGGEKIDVIEWSENAKQFIAHALSPAKVLEVVTNEHRREAFTTVPEEQLSLAIGKAGQNVRLAAKLTGWKIDVRAPRSEPIQAPEEPSTEAESVPKTQEDSAPTETPET